MLKVLRARWQQGHRTMRYPDGPAPDLPPRFAGRPIVDSSKCAGDCRKCRDVCPTAAIEVVAGNRQIRLDTGRCIFCRQCEVACGAGAIAFSQDYRLASSRRNQLVVTDGGDSPGVELDGVLRRTLGRSLKLRQVSRRRL